MPRYILIDNASGYIFGDTADMPNAHVIDGEQMRDTEQTPEIAARWLDEAVVGEHGRTYATQARPDFANQLGYHVYRADVNGSDAVGNILDGQSREMIEAVERDCQYVCFVAATNAED